jgi:hypothetical protein
MAWCVDSGLDQLPIYVSVQHESNLYIQVSAREPNSQTLTFWPKLFLWAAVVAVCRCGIRRMTDYCRNRVMVLELPATKPISKTTPA